MRIKDLEAHLVRQLEQQVLAALPSLLAAQARPRQVCNCASDPSPRIAH